MTIFGKVAVNHVPAAAVIRERRAIFSLTRCKMIVDGLIDLNEIFFKKKNKI